MEDAELFALNRTSWDVRTPVHYASRFYDVPGFKAGACSLKEIELSQVGDVAGKSLVHFQCHFGQDTLSWARRGATVTGLDLSGVAISTARSLAAEIGVDAKFVECNVFDAPEALGGDTFDIVFTSYGALGWLPRLEPWGRAVAACLKPGGVAHVVEFHPMMWMWDDAYDHVVQKYDGPDQPILCDDTRTYADPDVPISVRNVEFNHGVFSVASALLAAGLRVTALREYDWSPYPVFPDPEEVAPGRFRMRKFGDKLPLVYAIAATKA